MVLRHGNTGLHASKQHAKAPPHLCNSIRHVPPKRDRGYPVCKKKRVVVIMGAGGGIGAKIVERFLAKGDSIVGLDRSEQALRALEEASHARP